MEKIMLNGEWSLHYVKDEQVKQRGLCLNSIAAVKAEVADSVAATVPGNCEIDLHRAGVIGEPYYADNVIKIEALEDNHYYYCRTFDFDGEITGREQLVCEGIDTYSEIYLNGELIAETDNMLIPHKINAWSLKKGKNEIVVHILPTVIKAREFELSPSVRAFKYNYASLRTRKAPHMYAWDITPRIISAGIWRDIYIETLKPEYIDETYLYTLVVRENCADLAFFFRTEIAGGRSKDYSLKVVGQCGDSRFEKEFELWFNQGTVGITVNNPLLWWPRGSGEQNLYDVTVTLSKNGEAIDEKTFKTGIRTTRLERTDVTDKEGNGEFCFYVNGKKIFMKGTNWVPVDALHSRDRERIPAILDMVCDVGCNCIRLWGGNVYEDKVFYDLCDELGIVLWQDFIMGCAIYPQDADFQNVIRNEATTVVKMLRQHPSIILWAGDNEVDMSYVSPSFLRDPNTNLITRKVLPEVINEYDPIRPYLPSSPYICAADLKGKFVSEDHIWGPRDYYKGNYYGNTVCHFASEIGYHGCNAPKSVEKFISPEKIWPYDDNDEWLIHASSPERGYEGIFSYRIRLMASQIKTLFGEIPDNLEEFALASQISQAEADKYFIETYRMQKWRRTGIIWWNIIDGWPQFSDAVVDYYFNKKLAYGYIKRSQQDVCVMMSESKNGKHELRLVNDSVKDKNITVTVRDLKNGGKTVLTTKAVATAEASVSIATVEDDGEQHFYLISWEGDVSGTNHYMAGKITFDFKECVSYIKEAGYLVADGFNII